MHGFAFNEAATVPLDPNACELFLSFTYLGGQEMSKKTTINQFAGYATSSGVF
jgi:hypothetical protein